MLLRFPPDRQIRRCQEPDPIHPPCLRLHRNPHLLFKSLQLPPTTRYDPVIQSLRVGRDNWGKERFKDGCKGFQTLDQAWKITFVETDQFGQSGCSLGVAGIRHRWECTTEDCFTYHELCFTLECDIIDTEWRNTRG